jgi:hypothetical protein
LPHHFTWSATDHDLYEGFGASGAVETVVFPWKKGVFPMENDAFVGLDLGKRVISP